MAASDMGTGGRRSTRNTRRGVRLDSEKVPSAIHYLGYVEEDETPEMIMKKFEEMERIKEAATSGEREALASTPLEGVAPVATPDDTMEMTEEQMLEVFKRTSLFNVKLAVHNNEVLAERAEAWNRAGLDGSEGDDCNWEHFKQYLSDEDNPELEKRDRTRFAFSAGDLKQDRPSRPRTMLAQYGQHFQAFVQQDQAPTSSGRAPQHYRVPPAPVPPAWGKTIRPYEPARMPLPLLPDALQRQPNPHLPAGVQAQVMKFDSGGCIDWVKLGSQGPYQAVLVNSGWQEDGKPCTSAIGSGSAAGGLQAVPFQQLVPHGFIFIWAQKHEISDIFSLLCDVGYSYVENLTWVMIHVDKSILKLPDHYSRRSHMTLLIFRKQSTEGQRIELKHQRNADVVFECVTSVPGRPWAVPDEAYHAIETMLPQSYGCRMELWSGTERPRLGWLHVAIPCK